MDDKKPISYKHRKTMVELAINTDNKLSLLDLDDEKFSLDETLPKIVNTFQDAELYFIFGADVFLRMNYAQWPSLTKLLQYYIVVFERRDITQKELTAHAKKLGIVIAIIPSQHLTHSSTDVRMSTHNKSVWLPKVVADYIEKNNLYL